MRRSLRATTLGLTATLLALPVASRAQERALPRPAQQFAIASLNGMIGGTIAGLSRLIRGGSFTEAFLPGALGGTIAFGGRRLAVERFDGAGLLAREVSAVGASIVRNAGEGLGALERVQLPLGPVELEVRPREPGSVRARLMVYDAVRVASAIAQPELELDGWASLSAGTPVFRAAGRYVKDNHGVLVDGLAGGGVIYLSGRIRNGDEPAVFAHERVHVLQQDFRNIAVGDALESGAVHISRPTLRMHRWVGSNYVMPFVRGSMESVGIDWLRDADESEAYWLAG